MVCLVPRRQRPQPEYRATLRGKRPWAAEVILLGPHRLWASQMQAGPKIWLPATPAAFGGGAGECRKGGDGRGPAEERILPNKIEEIQTRMRARDLSLNYGVDEKWEF